MFENPAILWSFRTKDNPRRQRKKACIDGMMLATCSLVLHNFRLVNLPRRYRSGYIVSPINKRTNTSCTRGRPLLGRRRTQLMQYLRLGSIRSWKQSCIMRITSEIKIDKTFELISGRKYRIAEYSPEGH